MIKNPDQQIKKLDARLGVGVGAVRERAKLSALIAAEAERVAAIAASKARKS